MATRLLTSGSEFQVNLDSGGGNGILGTQTVPDAAALTDGRFVIGYQSALPGDNTNRDPIVRILGGIDYLDTFVGTQDQLDVALASRNDGGLGVAFTNDHHFNNVADANGPNITYRTVSAT